MPSLNTGNAILSNPIKVDSSYNVGIGGAASGSYKLQVTGTGNFTSALTAVGEILTSSGQIAISGSGGIPSTGVGIRYNGTTYVYAGANSFNVRKNDNSKDNFSVLDNGNVGIGVSSPESVTNFTTLQVDGTSGAMLRTGTSTYGGYVATIATADAMVLSNVRNPINGTFSNTGKAASVISLYGESGSGYLTFATSPTNNTGPTERMRMDRNGVLKIGNGGSADDGRNPSYANVAISFNTSQSRGEIQSVQQTISTYPLIINGAGGSVGIGTYTPPSKLSVQFDKNAAFSGLGVYDSQAFNAANHGGTVTFGGTYNSGGAYTEWSAIGGMKSNTTDGNVSGDINFYTRIDGSGMTERMRINSVGRMLLGTTTDYGYKETIVDSLNGLFVRVESESSGATPFLVQNNNSGGTNLFEIKGHGFIKLSAFTYNNTTTASPNLFVNNDGGLYRSTSSSIRYKDNVADWNGSGLQTILALKPKTFTYKEGYYNNPQLEMLGLIAEEVAEVSPFLAEYKDDNRSGQVENVRYANIVVPLIKAIQEMNQTIQNQQQQINSLINR